MRRYQDVQTNPDTCPGCDVSAESRVTRDTMLGLVYKLDHVPGNNLIIILAKLASKCHTICFLQKCLFAEKFTEYLLFLPSSIPVFTLHVLQSPLSSGRALPNQLNQFRTRNSSLGPCLSTTRLKQGSHEYKNTDTNLKFHIDTLHQMLFVTPFVLWLDDF